MLQRIGERLFILEHSKAKEIKRQKYQTIKAVAQSNREFLFTRAAEHSVQKIRGNIRQETRIICYK
jgi:hypothetical protein